MRACSARASWPTRSPSSPSAVRSGPSPPRRARREHVGAALARRAPGSPTRAPSSEHASGSDTGWSANSSARGRRERDRVGDGRERPQPPAPASARARRRAAASRRPRSRGGPPVAHPPAIGRRRITSPASSGSSSHLLGVPLALGHDGVVARVELLAERAHRRLDRRGVGRPSIPPAWCARSRPCGSVWPCAQSYASPGCPPSASSLPPSTCVFTQARSSSGLRRQQDGSVGFEDAKEPRHARPSPAPPASSRLCSSASSSPTAPTSPSA